MKDDLKKIQLRKKKNFLISNTGRESLQRVLAISILNSEYLTILMTFLIHM